jgi:hypothetical protein
MCRLVVGLIILGGLEVGCLAREGILYGLVASMVSYMASMRYRVSHPWKRLLDLCLLHPKLVHHRFAHQQLLIF